MSMTEIIVELNLKGWEVQFLPTTHENAGGSHRIVKIRIIKRGVVKELDRIQEFIVTEHELKINHRMLDHLMDRQLHIITNMG